MHGARLSSNKDDWTGRCVEAALGGLGALAAVTDGELVRDPTLRRLLHAVADEAATAARSAGRRLAADPGRIASKRCHLFPNHRHPWQGSLRRGRRTGAKAVFGPLLAAARRAGTPAPRLAVMAEVLRRLDQNR